MTYLLRFYICR